MNPEHERFEPRLPRSVEKGYLHAGIEENLFFGTGAGDEGADEVQVRGSSAPPEVVAPAGGDEDDEQGRGGDNLGSTSDGGVGRGWKKDHDEAPPFAVESFGAGEEWAGDFLFVQPPKYEHRRQGAAFKGLSKGILLSVVGCGGERDRVVSLKVCIGWHKSTSTAVSIKK